MAKVVFTPWKTQAQLLAVRDQFYPPPTYDGPDLRSQACAKVSIWKLRGSLTHPVEATALLTDAILHDDAGKNSIFSIRATYSAAFCRFVTGLVDAKIPGMRKTMFQRAIDLGLPASFVELRHEATHRELPSLIVLRNATQRSLEWLWDYYWAKVDPHAAAAPPVSAPVSADAEIDGDDLGVKESIRDTLSLLVKGEEGEEQQPPRKKRKAQYQTTTATQLVSICKASPKGAVVLSRVLLDESVLVPAGRRLGDSLHDTFIKWEQLLQMITESHAAFLSTLTEEMVNDLAFLTQNKDTKNNAYHEAIYTWLDHILRSTEWKSSRRLLSFSYLLAACEANPNHWTDMLKKILLKEEVKRAKGVVSLSVPQTQTQTQTEAMIVDVNADADAGALRELGWESLELWDSRPLGVA